MMKKFVILLFVLAASLSVKAQVYVGGSLGLWHNDDADRTSFTLAPEVGYELNEAWSVGATLAFTHSKTKVEKIKTITNGFAFAPYARYSFFNSKIIRLFVDGGIVNPEKPDVPLNKNDAFQKVQKRRVQEKR